MVGSSLISKFQVKSHIRVMQNWEVPLVRTMYVVRSSYGSNRCWAKKQQIENGRNQLRMRYLSGVVDVGWRHSDLFSLLQS